MTRYFLGVDIGATKSHALLADETGQVVGFGKTGAGNYEIVGWEGLREALHTITAQAIAAVGATKEQIAGAGFGIAGFDWPCLWDPHMQIIDELGLAAPCGLVNDTLIGLIAGAAEGWGVGIVSGTGSNCYGRDRQRREGRVTGGGGPFAEYAGGGDLVGAGVQAMALAWTRRGPTTRLTEAFIAHVGAADTTDLLEGLYLGRYNLSAPSAPLVFQVAAEGDAVAQGLIRWAGRELGSLVVGVIRQLHFESLEFDVVQIGSMFKGSPVLGETLMSVVQEAAPGARAVRLTVPPVVGGVLLGMEKAGIDYRPLRMQVITTAEEFLNR